MATRHKENEQSSKDVETDPIGGQLKPVGFCPTLLVHLDRLLPDSRSGSDQPHKVGQRSTPFARDIAKRVSTMNVSFSGCGFLGIYHIGVAAALKEYAPDICGKLCGASAGAIAACAFICDCLDDVSSRFLSVAIEARSRALGPLHPSFDLVRVIRESLEKHLPPNAHKIASGRLFISLTRFSDGANVLASEFDTRNELIEAIVCSAFIPLYSGAIPPCYKGTHFIDGGWSDNLPVLDENTVTVTPFAGESDICPLDSESSFSMSFDIKHTNIRFTCSNFHRLSVALLPPHPQILSNMCRQGFQDALRFLTKNNLISCTRCITIRSNMALAGKHSFAVVRDKSGCKKLSTRRALPRSISSLNFSDMCDAACEGCRQTAMTASAKGMPRIIQDRLASAASLENSLLSYLMQLGPVKLVRYMSLPWFLPLSMSVAVGSKILGNLPSICSSATSVAQSIIQSLIEQRKRYTASFTCRFAITELGYYNLTSDIGDEFCMAESGHVQCPMSTHGVTGSGEGQAPLATTTVGCQCSMKEMNIGFSVGLNSDSPAPEWQLDQKSPLFQQIPSTAGQKSIDLINADGKGQWMQEKQGLRRKRTNSSVGPKDVQELNSILSLTQNRKALMTFYYFDENRRVQLTEIYGIDSASGAGGADRRRQRLEARETSQNMSPKSRRRSVSFREDLFIQRARATKQTVMFADDGN